jgi:16S rRNA (guanine(527)-N(7))-methyltransferase RsmG
LSAELFRDLLAAEFAPWGVLFDDQLEKLDAHYRLLMQWNKRLNLTRITEVKEVVRMHYCESLFLAAHLPRGVPRIVDFGSGAGFPGMPVAIMLPGSSVGLVEAHQRKAVFLREASRGLPNVRVIPQRAEELSFDCDWVIARGVRPSETKKLRIAEHCALLVGEEDASKLPGERLKLPWGKGRYLVKFHVEHERARTLLPRGTFR